MIQFVRYRTFILLTGMFIGVPAFAQQDLLDYEHTLTFARYLSNTRQYPFAAQEYERLHFLWPDDTTVIRELVKTYRLDQDCSQFPSAYSMMAEKELLWKYNAFAREYLKFCLTCGIDHPQYGRITSMLEPAEAGLYRLGYYWTTQQFDSAFSYNHREAAMLSANHAALYNLTLDFQEQHYKKAWLAMAMSAVLPGSGKAYSKRWGDAAISFILVSTSAFASYRAFNRKGIKSVNGWIFGGVAFSFYSSNIYGSFKAARNHNEDIRKQYQEDAKGIINSYF